MTLPPFSCVVASQSWVYNIIGALIFVERPGKTCQFLTLPYFSILLDDAGDEPGAWGCLLLFW